MASEALTVIATLVGIGIIVVGVLVLMEMQKEPAATPATTVIVREPRRWWHRGWGPYYSHLPVRPLVY
jgi:hypothetical protein